MALINVMVIGKGVGTAKDCYELNHSSDQDSARCAGLASLYSVSTAGFHPKSLVTGDCNSKPQCFADSGHPPPPPPPPAGGQPLVGVCAVEQRVHVSHGWGPVWFVVAWALVTLSFQLCCPLEYEPAGWHVPGWLMPWLPSVAIGLLSFRYCI